MNYKMTWMKMEHRQATALVAIGTLVGVLVVGSIAEIGHLAFAYKSFSKGKRAIEQPTKINQNTECLTAGGNSPIEDSCTNTATTHSTNTGGVRGSTGDDGGISQPTNIDQKAICETAGGNSPIEDSCTDTANIGTTNTGGIGGVRGSTGGDDGGISQSNNIDQKAICETAGGHSGTQGSCINAGGSITSNTGGSASNTGGSASNTGGITGSIKLPFGSFP
jgi:hypothetical protein